jgi:hypothetical protein
VLLVVGEELLERKSFFCEEKKRRIQKKISHAVSLIIKPIE